MPSYIFIILFVFLTFYISKKIYKNKDTCKPLYKQIEEFDRCPHRGIFKDGQVDFNGKKLYYRIYSRNVFHNYINYITICFKSKSDDFFEIRKRTIIDRILIKLSLLNNKFYNRLLYIASDNPKLYHQLNSKLLQKIATIFSIKPSFKYKSLKLYNKNDEFCIRFFLSTYFTFRKKLKIEDIDIDKIVEDYGKNLLEILQSFHFENMGNENIFEKIKEKVLWARYLIVSSAIGSFFMLMYYTYQVFPQSIDTFRLIFLAFILSSVLAIIIFILIMIKLNKSSFKLQIASKYALLLLFSTMTISTYTIKYFNTIFDESKEKVVHRKVVDKYYKFKGGKYRLKFHYDYAQSITGNDVRVPYNIYKNIRIGDIVKIIIKNGYFDIQYISDIQGSTHNKS